MNDRKHICKIAAMSLLIGAGSVNPVQSADFIPQDVAPTCEITASEFSSWKDKGNTFQPADGLTFNDTKICTFYKWSWQTFLWLTSERNGNFVFNSDTFFDVDGNGDMTQDGNFSLRSEKFDAVAQAGSDGVLLDQNSSLVYYGVHVNNHFAYLMEGLANGDIHLDQYPDNWNEMQQVLTYESRHGDPGSDPRPMVMEIKTSWVKLQDSETDKHLTITGLVPDYHKDSNCTWTWNQKQMKKVTLGLVGMHVVATVKGHPEMVWSTFEHNDNAPNNTYFYYKNTVAPENIVQVDSFDASGSPVSKNWRFFSKDGNKNNANKESASYSYTGTTSTIASTSTIAGTNKCSKGIGPSNIYRINPWGSLPNNSQEKLTGSVPNNTMILSSNYSAQRNLDNDLRANYSLIASIWTSGGCIPGGKKPCPDSKLRGSHKAANATMETFKQKTVCFTCHSASGNPPNNFEISHIYKSIQSQLKK